MAFSGRQRGVDKYSLRDIRQNQTDFRAATRYWRGHYRRWLAA